MTPFNPQPLEELKARYPEALKELYIQTDVARGIQDRPGNKPKHIFDFQDRVRLIVSKEKEPVRSLGDQGRVVIHFSGSVSNNAGGRPLYMDDTILHHIVEHIGLLTGKLSEVELEFLMISNRTIAHFVMRLDN